MSRSTKTPLLPRVNHPGIVRLLIAAAILCGSAGLRTARADNMVTDWNNEFLLITQQTSGNLVAGPPEVAREIAQMGEAMSDAVNAASGSTISYFAYPGGSTANANANVAAATAAYTALSNIFTDPAWSTPIESTPANSLTSNPALAGNSSNTTLATNTILPELATFLSSELSSVGLTNTTACATSTTSLCNGYNLGISAAKAVDNATATSPTLSGAVAAITNGLNANAPAGSGVTPGVYIPPSATGGRPEMFPTWGSVAPTGLTSTQVAAAQALVSGPPPLNSAAYATALLQTECQGSSVGQANLPGNLPATCAAAGFAQTPAQAKADSTAALFWNDPGTTTQPPGHWLQIADNAMASQGTNLLKSAQLTALLGESMNDAGIAAWGDKYNYNLWRPVTAIRDCASSGNGVTWTNPNCDPAWSSLIATPPHPDYLAGHPAFSGSAATVLADFFGTDNIGFSSTSNYYCNGGTANVNAANQVISCTLSGTTYYICSATTTPEFNGGTQPVDCTDGTHTSALTGSDCNTVTSTGINNNSPLICAITETYSSFSEASSGELGAEFSRVVGGIHTPFAVEDALTVGDGIGQQIAAGAGLPDVLPEPSSLSVCALSVLALGFLRRRRFGHDHSGQSFQITSEA
jgi:hypothetical protein